MNTHLRKHGLGTLDDPTILDQLAFFIRSHEKFRDMLMKVTPEQRAVAYKAIAPRIKTFKPRKLEDYEAEGKRLAENLPVFDPVTWAVTESRGPNISEEAKQAITGKTLEERQARQLTEKAEDAIAEDLGKSAARGRLSVECAKCLSGTTVYALDRIDAYATLAANGWVVSAEGDKVFCPECAPAIVIAH